MMKTEPVEQSFSGYMDDEFYEDTGELQLPRSNLDITLTRIPEWLYEKISNWDELAQGNDDDQITLGEIISFPESKAKSNDGNAPPMRLFFNDSWHRKSGLPTAFELSSYENGLGERLQNRYIFTEKDLPNYKPNGVGQNKTAGSFGAVQDPKYRIYKRGKYKKAIPKQTALVGSASRQYLAKPLNTAEYIAFAAARNKQAIQGANRTTNITEDDVNEFNEMDKTQMKFASFIRSAAKRKPQLNKASRIARNDLIDILHTLFDEYAYWPMKALKQRTKQPEVYLKEVLNDIAVLVKSGSFASCWTRQPQYNTNAHALAQLPPGLADIDSGDDDDEEEMEDVM